MPFRGNARGCRDGGLKIGDRGGGIIKRELVRLAIEALGFDGERHGDDGGGRLEGGSWWMLQVDGGCVGRCDLKRKWAGGGGGACWIMGMVEV